MFKNVINYYSLHKKIIFDNLTVYFQATEVLT